MRINSIELEGYGSYRDYNDVTLPDGISGIVGTYDNKTTKSNGTGKSTFVTSILYAFFGKGEFEKLDELLNDNVDKMYVKIKFSLKGQNYSVERGINKGSSYLDFFENDTRLGSTTITKTQEEINTVLGMDHKMFISSVFFMQNEMDRFINTEAEKRREYVDKTLGIDFWRVAGKEAFRSVTRIDKERKELKNSISILEDSILSIKTTLLKKDEYVNSLKELTKEQISLKEQIDSIKEISHISDKIQLLEESYQEAKSQRDQASTELSLLESSFDNTTLLIELKASLDSITADLVTKKKDLTSYQEQFVEYGTTFKNLSTDEVIKFDEITNLHNKKNLLNSSRNNIISGKCPVCKQEVDVSLLEQENLEIDKQLLDTTELLSKLESPYLRLKENIDLVLEKKTKVQENIDDIKQTIQNLEKEKIVIESKIATIDTQLASLADNKNKKKEEYSLYSKKVEKIKIDITKEKALLPEVLPDKSIMDLESSLSTNSVKIDTLNKEMGKIEQNELLLEKTQNELETTLENITSVDKNYYINSVLSTAFKEIPRTIFKDSVVAIQESANNIIQQVIPDLSVSIYEDTSKKIPPLMISFEKKGKPRSYKRLSGGQKVVANIGIRLGFSKVISDRAQTQLQFIVMDEPFGALDEENRALVKSVLSLMCQYFKQILVISHTDDVNDFPNIIKVNMDRNDVSTISYS